MAEVTLWKQHLEGKSLPQVYVVTGQPATKWVRMSYSNRPAWIYLLFFVGILIAAIVDHLVTKYVRAQLPVAAEVARRRQLFTLAGSLGLPIGSIVFIIGLADASVMWIVGLVVVVAAIVALAMRSRGLPKGKVEPNGQYVDLVGVSEGFAAALAASAPPPGYAPWAQPAYPSAGEEPWEPPGGWGSGGRTT